MRATAEFAADGSKVLHITEGRICFCLNGPVSRHPGVGMEQARASLATMEM